MYKRHFAAATALAMSMGLSACGGMPSNGSLVSANQPVVEHSNYTLDLAAGGDGLSIPEQRRVAEWFETMDLRYGDRVALDGPLGTGAIREDVGAIAGRYGLLLDEGAPVTEGYVEPGRVRVVLTRSRAYVPGCPNWSDTSASNLNNATNNNFGCAVNSNFAAMVADSEHLLKGATGTGETAVMSSNKAINTYRETEPTGKAGLPTINSQPRIRN